MSSFSVITKSLTHHWRIHAAVALGVAAATAVLTGALLIGDSGRRSDRIGNLAELKLIEIISAEGLGRFGLTPSQLAPRNAYVSLADVQSALEVPDKVNSIFVSEAKSASGQGGTSLHDQLSPQLIDCGLVLKHAKRTFGEGDKTETIYDYYSLSSE